MRYFTLFLFLATGSIGFAHEHSNSFAPQPNSALVAGVQRAIAYSGFREGQHPDRGDGAALPSKAEILEDLEILTQHGFHFIRLYDSDQNSLDVLKVIRDHELPVKVMLGAWLDAEKSNHETCGWLSEPIPEEQLAAHRISNETEVTNAIALAKEYSDIIVAVNVGNETLVEWNDHGVPIERMVGYLRQVREAIDQPVTTAENYRALVNFSPQLQGELDFLGVHTYPIWEEKSIDAAIAYTEENLREVQLAYPNTPIAIAEAGWTSKGNDLGKLASRESQARHFKELSTWTADKNVTLFWFEAFDEPWKGAPNNPDGAEKHWGLWDVQRHPKPAVELLQ
ncbi:MAG: glycosyl hydrolase family 17 protein [Lentimonas sp.]